MPTSRINHAAVANVAAHILSAGWDLTLERSEILGKLANPQWQARALHDAAELAWKLCDAVEAARPEAHR